MSFAKLVLSTSSVLAMPKPVNTYLPQRYEITPLIDHYLENIHALYPFLSESKLFKSIDAVYQENGRHALPIDRWTTRLVLATAIASLSRVRGDTRYQDSVRHVAAALEEIETVVRPGSMVGIQAILQLVLYALLDPRHFNSWYLVGLASRVMVDLGLHQDPPEELRLNHSELDMRLRIYQCVYALDRSVTTPFLPSSYGLVTKLSMRFDFFSVLSICGITCTLDPSDLSQEMQATKPVIVREALKPVLAPAYLRNNSQV